ncbi:MULTISPECIES: hypothetical protein [Streptomyces]|uniref:Sensor domain-containing protein n=1 Tax=Streptomyces dengpaensis TaxID=2049881 RepID=A0ABM6SQE5_9ACTN|nr:MULTISPECIES: hypothetical protein [Streptomyces]AVH56901.1 hypothetical protein C4B68_15160 [Streptomyces dengpaensis]PIB04750.1 hypothetical protein B1C81_31855 [Streptomyces sp. HG99]
MRIRTTAVAVATAAALLTGCSDSGSGSEKPGAKSPGSEQTAGRQPDQKAAAGAVLSEAELRQALATATEATGYQAKDNDVPATRPKADKAACRALADMTATGTTRTPEANAWASRSFTSESAEPGLSVTTSLFSYEGEGAQQTVAGIREALDACADGFTTTGNNGGATITYTSVTAEQPLEGGEEAVSWVMTGEAQGQQVPMHLTAVREGNTLAVFFTIHLLSPEKTELPKDLFDTQMTKLADAVKSA